MMIINGEKTQKHYATLHDACLDFTDDPEAVATAINGDFVPKASRKNTLLKSGDHIEIIAPLEGG